MKRLIPLLVLILPLISTAVEPCQSKRCQEWFVEGVLANKVRPGQLCEIDCGSLAVNMGTFQCPSYYCESFCSHYNSFIEKLGYFPELHSAPWGSKYFKKSLEIFAIYQGLNPKTVKEKKLKELGLAFLFQGDQNYCKDQGLATQLQNIAKSILDLLVGIDPITGLARDAYETVTGKNFVTGEKLSQADQAFALLGVATLGFGSKINKGFKILSRVAKKISSKGYQQFSKASQLAKKIVERNPKIKRIYPQIRGKGFIKDGDSFKHFNKVSKLNNPLPKNARYAKVVHRDGAIKIINKKQHLVLNPKETEAFITALDEVKDIKGHKNVASKLSLFEDRHGTKLKNIDDHVILEFDFKDNRADSIRSPIQYYKKEKKVRKYGWVPGGRTKGGAREWLIDADANMKGYLTNYKIREIKK